MQCEDSKHITIPLVRTLTAYCFLAIPIIAAAATPDSQPIEVNLLAMGDWGQVNARQAAVAAAMARYVPNQNASFHGVLLAGDNFSTPLTGTSDTRWTTMFEQMYDPKVLAMPFYATLGNKDYEGGKEEIEFAYAVQNPTSRWKLPSHWYRLDLPTDHPLVTVLMLDSNRDNLSANDWKDQIQWIDAQLADVGGKRWTICCAHHTMFSNGIHGDNGVLQTEWGAIFRRHRLDFYVCGHDHDLQHLEIKDWPVSFVLCGGGGKPARSMLRDDRGPFSRAMNGFVHLKLGPDVATLRFIDADVQVVHAFERTRQGAIRTLSTTDSDKRTTHPLRVIQGIEDRDRPATAPGAGN